MKKKLNTWAAQPPINFLPVSTTHQEYSADNTALIEISIENENRDLILNHYLLTIK
jgi:hypothetical protein